MLLRVVVALVVVSSVAVAAPAARDKAAARAAFERAMRDYNLGDFADALQAFREAYRQYPDAAFLLNIGQCQRQLGDKQAAVRSYRAYLREAPKADNRGQVESLITELEAALARDEQVKLRPPQEPANPVEVEPPRPVPPLVVAPPAPPPVAVVAAPPPPPPRPRRWVGGVVAGVVIVAVGVGLGVGLGLGLSPRPPDVTLGSVRGN